MLSGTMVLHSTRDPEKLPSVGKVSISCKAFNSFEMFATLIYRQLALAYTVSCEFITSTYQVYAHVLPCLHFELCSFWVTMHELSEMFYSHKITINKHPFLICWHQQYQGVLLMPLFLSLSIVSPVERYQWFNLGYQA